MFYLIGSVQDEETSPGCILLLGSCIHCPQRQLEEDFCGQEAPLRACSKEFRIKRSTFFGWEIVPEAGEEEEERSEACQVIQKEEAGHKMWQKYLKIPSLSCSLKL